MEQSFSNGKKGEKPADNKRDLRLETPQVPYQREELLSTLAKRMRHVTAELRQVEELPPSREKAARLRQLSNWYETLASASKKFSQVTKEELADPSLEGQVWVSGDFQARLNEMASDEDEGNEAVARTKSRVEREQEERTSKENVRFMEMREMEREDTERDLEAKMARTPIGDRDVEMELEDQDIDQELTTEQVALAKEPTMIKRRKRSRAEDDAYIAQLGEKLGVDEVSGERLTDAGREQEQRLALMKGLEELEDISLEAMNRVKIQANELRALNKRLEDARAQLASGSTTSKGVLAAVEAALVPAAQKLKEEGKAAWNDVLMIEKQIASVREQLAEAGGPVKQEEIQTRVVKTPLRSRTKKSA